MDDPLRMFLIMRRGAIERLDRAAELAGAAAVACVRRFADDPEHAELLARWRRRPGKVALRARGGQWEQVQAEPHVVAGEIDGEAVLAIPPRPRSARGDVLGRLQATTSPLQPPPAEDEPEPAVDRLTYILNPRVEMSSGKTMAQVAHAAVIAADTGALEPWIAAGAPGRVVVPTPAAFDRLRRASRLAACVQDGGLTEVAPGTVTVLALPPR